MKRILSTIALTLLLISCDTEELHDLNTNQQAPNKLNMRFLFTAVEMGMASGGSRGDNRYIDRRTNINLCGHAIQQIATTDLSSMGDKYINDDNEVSEAPWDFLYNDVLQNTAEILRQTGFKGFEEGKNKNLRQITRILSAYNFIRLTDFYGNIPHREATKGIEGILFPKYDTQENIYKDLLKEVDEAVNALEMKNEKSKNDDDVNLADADIIYSGDIVKWKRFGNTLLLRMAMRLSNVDIELSNTYVSKATKSGVMASNNDICKVGMATGPNQWVNQNGISRAFAKGDGGQQSVLSATLVDWLKKYKDPRLMIFSGGVGGVKIDPSEQIGLKNGLDGPAVKKLLNKDYNSILDEFSIVNPKLLDLDEDYVFMNYSEAEFLLAEAAERKIGGITDAADHYKKGVIAALQQYTVYDKSFKVSNEEAESYLNRYPYSGLESIGEQLWVSKFMNWWEAWSDWRRTGFPKLGPVNYPNNVTGGSIPRKLRVPLGEVAANPYNFEKGATLPNEITNRVWWDTK